MNKRFSILAVVIVGAFILLPFVSHALLNQQVIEGGGGGGGGVTAQCSDGIDNDGNGLTDYPSDLGCTSALDNTESGYTPPPPVVTQCNDGIDNDGNGPIDYPADLGCTSAADTTESGYVTTSCSNTIDDDGDGKIDLADTGCSSAAGTSESPNPQCSDGADNDLNGKIDYPADLGCTSAYDNTESGYIPPAVPGAGVVIYSNRPDYVNAAEACTNGGVCTHFDSTKHNTGSSPSASGQRTCQILDPVSWESYWEAGGYNSCGDNSQIYWDGTKWILQGACSGNNHYRIINCTTLAVPDTSLTANGQSGTITVSAGTPVTLAWNSTYGSIRKGTFTTTPNFDLNTLNPAYCVPVQELYCPGNALAVGGNKDTKQLAGAGQVAIGGGCYFIDAGQNCYPAALNPHPYSGSTTTTPTQPGTYTYTYTGTNANGSSFSTVVVNVAGTTQCTNLIDDDGDGKVDGADPGCSGVSGNPSVPENSDMPELNAGSVSPVTANAGQATTFSATITNSGGVSTGAGFTNLLQRATDAAGTGATDVATYSYSSSLPSNGTVNATFSYTFPSAATWYLRACADKSSAGSAGTITESNETNNCGAWTAVVVANAAPTAFLSVSSATTFPNVPVTLTWTSNGTSCTGSNFATGGLANSSTSVSPSTTTTYSLDCVSGAGVHGYDSKTVTVIAAPSLLVTASKSSIRTGDSTTISWNGGTADSCTISGTGLSASTVTGSQSVTLTNQATYNLNCTKNGTSFQASTTVRILPKGGEI